MPIVTVQVGWSGEALPLREALRFGPSGQLRHPDGPKQQLCGGLRLRTIAGADTT